jgi:RNA polymerase sigma factor (sigma-70 family)
MLRSMALTDSSSTHLIGGGAQFPATLWSIVIAAGSRGASARAAEAMTSLCQAYWYPLYAFLRRQGKTAHDAEDLTQAFFLHLLQKAALEKVDRAKGKFRSFLLTSLKNFLADDWKKSHALKRGGGATIVSIDADMAEARYQDEPADQSDPEKLFERRWAITLLDRVLQRLEAEWNAAGKSERFEQLKIFLSGEPSQETYAQIAPRLRMTEGALKVAVLRMRHRYRDLFRAEIANTVADENEIDNELKHLLHTLARR